MKDFKKLEIWQTGFQIAVNCYKITERFPGTEARGLSSQITKAAVSIPSNIAEGSGRSSEKEYNRFIEISLGSCFELETQLLLAKSLNYDNQDLINQTLVLLASEQKMLMCFSRVLQKH